MNEIKEEMVKMSVGEGKEKNKAMEEVEQFLEENEDITDQVECFIDKIFVSKTDRLLRILRK